MTEHELHSMWERARWHIIVSGIAPTVLLAAIVGLVMAGLGAQPGPIKVAAALVLLASGILGAAVQISATQEAEAIAADLVAMGAKSAVSQRIIATARRGALIRIVTPIIFVVTYLALLWAIFAPQTLGGMQPAILPVS